MSKSKIRWIAVLGLVVVAAVAWPVVTEWMEGDAPEAQGAAGTDATISDRLETLAEKDHIKLLEDSLSAWNAKKHTGFTCTFIKQERIDGKLGKPQKMKVKCTEKPFRVAMAFEDEGGKYDMPDGDRIVYIEGENKDDQGRSEMIVRPTNKFARGLVGGSVRRLPTADDVMESTLRPCTQFGVANNLQSLIDVYKLAKDRGELTQKHGYADKKTGKDVKFVEFDGHKCLVLVRDVPERKEYPAARTITYLDIDRRIPLRVMGYNDAGKLVCDYQIRDLKIADLTAQDFSRKANDIKE